MHSRRTVTAIANAVHIVDVTFVFVSEQSATERKYPCRIRSIGVEEASEGIKGEGRRQRQKGEATASPYVDAPNMAAAWLGMRRLDRIDLS